jgi:IMP dehydrogenase
VIVAEVEIGGTKRGRRAYSFDDIALVPTRRTRNTEDVSTNWKIDAYDFSFPIIAAPMDSVVSPEIAINYGKLGGLAVIDLEGLWTRYEDPEAEFKKITNSKIDNSVELLQKIYSAPIKPELIKARIKEIKSAGVIAAAALSPNSVVKHSKAVVEAGVDIFVIRGTTVSAEHVSAGEEPLNLKEFIYQLDVPVIVGGCASHQAALHLMKTGAAGVLVGFGGGAAHTSADVLGVRVPMATAVADVAAARREYLDESGGRYVHVIADGSVGKSGDISKAIAMGADAVMIGSALARSTTAPGGGKHWGSEAVHQDLPRGQVVELGIAGTLEQILFGPSTNAQGSLNLVGALKKAMATTGYSDLKELQRIEVVVNNTKI